jgi:hypothetical protein
VQLTTENIESHEYTSKTPTGSRRLLIVFSNWKIYNTIIFSSVPSEIFNRSKVFATLLGNLSSGEKTSTSSIKQNVEHKKCIECVREKE